MREILFRAKRKDNGKWVEGYYSPHPHPFSGFLKDFIFAPYYDAEKECGYDNGYQIDVETLCQYTGLTDKNGNKIWENDIIKCYADTDDLGNDLYFFYKVIWHENYHCWWLSDIHTLEDEYLHQFNSSDIEAIGNIFDNPEPIEI